MMSEEKLKPRFAEPTVVQPKDVDRLEPGDVPKFRNAEQDQVRSSFSNAAHVGIRSLPNALAPNFRKTLFKEVLQHTMKYSTTESGTGSGGQPDVSKAPALSTTIAKGQRRPAAHSSAPNMFTQYDYQPSEYSLKQEVDLAEKHADRSKWLIQDSFTVRALPSIPKHSGAFNEFEYHCDPYERFEEKARVQVKEQNEMVKFGPLKAGGHIHREEHMKTRADEMMQRMAKCLKKDWPGAFLRVFEDPQGLMVVCYDKLKMGEGDITSYMNQLFRANPIVEEFKLRRDTTRWGVMEDTVPNVYYVFIPPWVHARIIHPELCQVPDNKPVPGISEPPLQSGRVPFMPTTESGVKIPISVQTYARSFKT